MRIKYKSYTIIAFALLNLIACGGGGGGGSKSQAVAPAIGNFDGQWQVFEKIDERGCGEGQRQINYTVTVKNQTANSLTIVAQNNSITASINGNSLSYSITAAEGIGTTTQNVNVTVDTSCNYFSGTSNWNYSDANSSCSGTTELSGTRLTNLGCGNKGGNGGGIGNALAAPSGLRAESGINQQVGSYVNLFWIDNSRSETGFEVQISDQDIDSTFKPARNKDTQLIDYVPANSTDVGLVFNNRVAPGTILYFRVRAINNSEQSAFTAHVPASIK